MEARTRYGIEQIPDDWGVPDNRFLTFAWKWIVRPRLPAAGTGLPSFLPNMYDWTPRDHSG